MKKMLFIFFISLAGLVNAQTTTIYPTYDSYTDNANPATNYNGQNLDIATYNTNPVKADYICLKFDIPAGTVESAQLILTLKSGSGIYSNLGVYGITSSWTETTVNQNWLYSNYNINSYIDNFNESGGNLIWNIPKTVIQAWADDPSQNFGFVILDNTGTAPLSVYYDKENGSTGNEPKLIVSVINGIDENICNNIITHIFPNPTSDNLIIDSPKNSTLEVLNVQGQLLKILEVTAGKTSIDVSSFPIGLYVVEIKTQKGIEVKRFVKD